MVAPYGKRSWLSTSKCKHEAFQGLGVLSSSEQQAVLVATFTVQTDSEVPQYVRVDAIDIKRHPSRLPESCQRRQEYQNNEDINPSGT